MSRKLKASIVILAAFGVALGVELWFNGDNDPDTPTITQLVVENLHPELIVLVVGGFVAWLVYHFGVRVLRRKRDG